MSQEQLDAESGVSHSTISELELGQQVPETKTLRDLRRLCETLNISLLEAYERAGLLEFADERDAIVVAQLVREMDDPDRRKALMAVRAIAERKE